MAEGIQKQVRSMLEGIAHNESTRRAIQNAARIGNDYNAAMRAMPPQSVQRSLEAAKRTLNSPHFQRQIQEVRRVVEMMGDRLGADGMAATITITPRYLESNRNFEVGYERAIEKIQDGRADEVLDEAAALASRAEVLETVERADKYALIEEAERLPEQDSEGLAGGVRAEIDFKTVLASIDLFSEEDVQTIEYGALQIMRFLTIAVSVAVVVGTSTLLAQMPAAIAGMYALVDFVIAVRRFNQGSDS